MSTLTREPVLITMSVLAGVTGLTSAAAFSDAVSPTVALWAVLAVAAVQAGVQFYVRGLVTPIADPHAADGAPLVPTARVAPPPGG